MTNRCFAALLFSVSLFGQGGFNGPGRYEISNLKSGKVMDLDRNDQATVIQFSSRGTDNQTWDVVSAGRDTYYFRNGMNGNALTAVGAGNSTPVQGMPFTGGPEQQWRIESGKDGNAVIVSVSGKVLDIPDGTSRDGARIQIYDRTGDSNQRFMFRPLAGYRGGFGGDRAGYGRGEPPRDRGPNYGNQGQQIVTCTSDDGRRRYCDADTRGGVLLSRQISGSPCVQGQTWGYDDRGIWVDRGCRAEFQINASSGATITCSSDDGGRRYCNADTRGGVVLTRQISGSPCIQGRTWGFDERGIWVDRGCRAEFQVQQRRYR
jgi:hypothetical protein